MTWLIAAAALAGAPSRRSDGMGALAAYAEAAGADGLADIATAAALSGFRLYTRARRAFPAI